MSVTIIKRIITMLNQKLTLNEFLRIVGVIFHNGSGYHTFNLVEGTYRLAENHPYRICIMNIQIVEFKNGIIRFHSFNRYDIIHTSLLVCDASDRKF